MDTNKDNSAEMEAELKTRFGLLPEDIQKVITSSDYQMKLFELSKKYKLTYDQLGEVEMETTMTLLGLANPNEYLNEIASKLGKKPEEVRDFVEEIKQQIFTPIHESLVNLYQEGSVAEAPGTDASLTSNEQATLSKSGITLGSETPAQATPATPPIATENRTDMLKDIENPPKTTARVLNEVPAKAPSATLPQKGMVIPVPRAPYADKPAMSSEVIPLTAKPAENIMAGKLGGTFAVAPKTTDLSVKNSGTTPTPPTGGDSYREPID